MIFLDDNGDVFELSPLFRHFVDPDMHYFVGQGKVSKFVNFGDEYLPTEDARALCSMGVLTKEQDSLFSDLHLCRAIFSWERKNEIDFICSRLDYCQAGPILDVGCGWGAILIEMSKRGYTVEGIDKNPFLVSGLREEGFIATCADSEWATLSKRYTGAFSAMNSLRYLRSRSAVLRHFRSMATNLDQGAHYLFQLTVDGIGAYRNKWSYQYEGEEYEILWSKHFSDQSTVVDKVEIFKGKHLIKTEFQRQCHLSKNFIEGLLESIKTHFELVSVYLGTDFHSTTEIKSGVNQWIEVRRK